MKPSGIYITAFLYKVSVWLIMGISAGLWFGPAAKAQMAGSNPLSAEAYADSAMAYAYDCHTEKAKWFADQVFEQTESTPCTTCIAKANYALGIQAYERGYMQTAASYYQKALLIYENAELFTEAAFCAAGLGHSQLQMAKPDAAVQLTRKALLYASKSGDTVALASGLYVSGMYYLQQKKYDEATTYFTRVLLLTQRPNIAVRLHALAHCHLAAIQHQTRQTDLALKSCMDALLLARTHALDDVLATVYAQVAWVYLEKGENDKALQSVARAIATDSATNHQADLARHWLEKSILLERMKSYDKAISSYQTAVSIATTISLNNLLGEVYSHLATLYLQLGEKEQSAFYANLNQLQPGQE